MITTSLTLANGLLVSAYLTAEKYQEGLSCRSGTWGPWHTPLQWQPTPPATFPQSPFSLSLSSFSLSFSFPHSLGARCTRVVRPSVRPFVRPSVRQSASPVACTDVCYPTFLPQALYIRLSFRPVRPIDREYMHRTLAHWELTGSYNDVSVHDEMLHSFVACKSVDVIFFA